jgi:hypothetical protein
MNKICVVIVLLFLNSYYAQNKRIRENIPSNYLQKDVEVIIELPESYQKNTTRLYPWILLLEGDYFMDIFSGNLSYGNYWDLYPESILVGITHANAEERQQAFDFNQETGAPLETSTKFYNFLRKELLPNLNKSFRLINFNMIAGFDYSAGFMNNFMYQETNLFSGYISISPELEAQAYDRVRNSLKDYKNQNLFYYLASSTGDNQIIRENTQRINDSIAYIDNENIKKKYDLFEGYSHYAIPPSAVPNALNFIYETYAPISKNEYDTKIKKLDSLQVNYLVEKYQKIEKLFGMKKSVRITDVYAMEDIIILKKNYNEFQNLANFVKIHFPKTLLEKYFIGLMYEKKDLKIEALKSYKSAYPKEEVGKYTRDMIYEKIEAMRE